MSEPTVTRTTLREIVNQIEKKEPTPEVKPWQFSGGRQFRDYDPEYSWAANRGGDE